MKFHNRLIVGICTLFFIHLDAQPIIRSIENKTPFQFTIVAHNDISGCSPLQKGQFITIEPFSKYTEQLLLGSEKPGLLLRPSAFYDQTTKKFYSFLDQKGTIDQKKLSKAFEAWKKSRGKRKYTKDLETWFAQWLCGDISLIHNHMEVFGYLLNISIARIDNEHHYHACMVDYSEGLFSRQMIDIVIEQKTNKGIVPHVKTFVGQGGLCKDGEIVPLQ